MKVYIVLTYSGTILSKIIKLYTRNKYSHASLSFDEDLNEMYSFGRLNAYNPFIGGFVHENVKWGTFKRFKKTRAAIYSLEVTNEQYLQMKKIVEAIKENKDDYKFNTLGLMGVVAHLRVKRINHFYCAEFVKYLIDKANIDLGLPKIVKPCDFTSINNLTLSYEGLLLEYVRV